MATQVGRFFRHDGVVAGAGWDISVAVGAEVHLGGLIRLQEADVNLAIGFWIIHRGAFRSSEEQCPGEQGNRGQAGGNNEHDVGGSSAVRPCGIHTHGVSIVPV
jgi:hypothetical protein